jgi:hypothetical protein
MVVSIPADRAVCVDAGAGDALLIRGLPGTCGLEPDFCATAWGEDWVQPAIQVSRMTSIAKMPMYE